MTELYFSIVECALAPDIHLEGRILTNNDSNVLQLICSTNIAVQLCTFEFLIDKRTHDTMRYFNNSCYHKMWICTPTVCTCSDDCMSFTLNVTVTQDMMNHSYSCASRIEKDGIIYFGDIEVKHDGNGVFILFKKSIVPYSSVTSTQKVTTFSPEIRTVSFISAPLLIAVAAFGLLSCVLLVIILLMICRRYCNSKTEDKSRNNNALCEKQNEINSNVQDVFQVQAEVNSAGTRFSLASSNQSDNISVDLLIDNINNMSVV